MKIKIFIKLILGNKVQKRFIRFSFLVLLLSNIFNNKVSAQIFKGDPLPPIYSFANIGEPINGPTIVTYTDSIGQYVIDHTGGFDTGWGTSDQCCMIYFQTQQDKQIVAKLISIVANGWNSKGFIMVRSSVQPEAAMCFFEMRNVGDCDIDWRVSTGFNNGNSAYTLGGGTVAGGIGNTYLKFIRQGMYVMASYSKDQKTWTKVGGWVKLKFTGPVIMGIGAAACSGNSDIVTFQDFVVQDIVLPYHVTGDTVNAIKDITMNAGTTSSFGITNVFGHYLNDPFLINATSTDTSVVKVNIFKTLNPTFDNAGGDQFFQNMQLTALKYGIANIKLSTNIAGYNMTFDIPVLVNGPHVPPVIVSKDPSPWTLKDFGIGAGIKPSEVTFNNSINDTVLIYGNRKCQLGGDSVTCLYQLYNKSDSFRVIAHIDSVSNTGKGSFAGIMIRDTNIIGSPFVSLSIGATEGSKFSYRWADSVDITNITDTSYHAPCWLMLKYGKDDQGNTNFQPYFSKDRDIWAKLTRYPLTLNFLNNKILAGLTVQGGVRADSLRPSLAVVDTFGVTKDTSQIITSSISIVDRKESLAFYPNPLGDEAATIKYTIGQPGNVKLAVYDVYGKLIDVLVSGYQAANDYSIDYDHAKLKNSGVYILKLISKGNSQTLKFIYQ